jgi:transposase InsO family protein
MKLPLFTISQLAFAFRQSRDTVRARLRDGAVKPKGKQRGVDVYELRAAAAALTDEAASAFQLRARRQTDLLELELSKRRGLLCEAQDVERVFARRNQIVAHLLGTLPDQLERECGLAPAAVDAVEKVIDAAREAAYCRMTDLGNHP